LSLPLKGRAGKLAYSVGSIGDTGFYQVINGWLLYFLTVKINLNPWLAGLAFAISFGVWNAINDPIIGSLSDRTRTRFGRRKPFIAIGAPLTLLFFVILWIPPTGGKPLAVSYDIGVFIFITIILAAWAWTYSMAAVIWFAIYPEMWESVKERSEVVVYRQVFAIVGGALAVAVFPILVASLSGEFGEFDGWIWAGLILGIIFAGAYLFSLLGIKERKEFLAEKPLSMGKAIKTTFSNRTLRTYVIIDLMTWCMTSHAIFCYIGSWARRGRCISFNGSFYDWHFCIFYHLEKNLHKLWSKGNSCICHNRFYYCFFTLLVRSNSLAGCNMGILCWSHYGRYSTCSRSHDGRCG
jgi:Na+/melibiose symporter-like transporter